MSRNAKSSSSKPKVKVFRRVYSRKSKLDAVLLVTQDGYSLAAATRSLGVHVSQIRKWEEKFMPQDKDRLNRPPNLNIAPLFQVKSIISQESTLNIKFTLSYILFGMFFLGCDSQAESPPNNHLQTPVDSSIHGTVATPSSRALKPQSSSRQIPSPTHEPVVAKLPWRMLVPDKEFSVIPGTDTLRVSFSDLNLENILDMQTIPVDAAKHFPNWLKLLDGKRIRISGYMYFPHKETNLSFFRMVPALQIMNFGAPIRADEVIVVLLQKNKTTDYQQNRRFDVEGTFKIAPIVEEGELLELYQLEEALLILR